jgi:hypothetical protein
MSHEARTAPAGRERSCDQCGVTYHAHRANSRYCSHRCIKRAQRSAKTTPAGATASLQRWLIKRGYAGPTAQGVFALTVPVALVLKDLNAAAARIVAQGLRSIAPVTEADLKAALRDMKALPA